MLPSIKRKEPENPSTGNVKRTSGPETRQQKSYQCVQCTFMGSDEEMLVHCKEHLTSEWIEKIQTSPSKIDVVEQEQSIPQPQVQLEKLSPHLLTSKPTKLVLESLNEVPAQNSSKSQFQDRNSWGSSSTSTSTTEAEAGRKRKSDSKPQLNVKREKPEEFKECEHCQETFPYTRKRDKKLFEDHLEMHYGEREWVCPICNRGFTTVGILMVHTASHGEGSEQYQFDCPNCSEKFKYNSKLQAHLKNCQPWNRDESEPEPSPDSEDLT